MPSGDFRHDQHPKRDKTKGEAHRNWNFAEAFFTKASTYEREDTDDDRRKHDGARRLLWRCIALPHDMLRGDQKPTEGCEASPEHAHYADERERSSCENCDDWNGKEYCD